MLQRQSDGFIPFDLIFIVEFVIFKQSFKLLTNSILFGFIRNFIWVASTHGRVYCIDGRTCTWTIVYTIHGGVGIRLAVMDVTALGQLYTLHIVGCIAVMDVTAPGQLYTLYMVGLGLGIAVIDIFALGQLYTLYMVGCSAVIDVTSLGQL